MRHTARSAEDFLPVKPAVVLILLVLGEGELHGYAIAQAVRARSNSRVKLETGPLYRHLKRLLDSGLVVEAKVQRPTDRDERRRYYRLTQLGREVLALEAERLSGLVDATRQLGLEEGA